MVSGGGTRCIGLISSLPPWFWNDSGGTGADAGALQIGGGPQRAALTLHHPLHLDQQSDSEEVPKNVVDVDEEDDSDEDVSSAL